MYYNGVNRHCRLIFDNAEIECDGGGYYQIGTINQDYRPLKSIVFNVLDHEKLWVSYREANSTIYFFNQLTTDIMIEFSTQYEWSI